MRSSLIPLLGAVFLGLGAACPAHAQNLLSNGSMEGTYGGGVAPGWEKAKVDTRAVFSISESGAGRSGKCHLLEVTERLQGFALLSGPTLASAINVVSGAPQGIVAGKFYEASVWVRSDRRELQDVVLAVDDGGTRQGNAWQPLNFAKRLANVGQGWTQLVLRFRAELGKDGSGNPITQATYARFVVRLHQEGKLWVDDASFRELTAADYETPASANVIRNASFELGAGGWPMWNGLATVQADATAPHGGNVLKVSWYGLTSARLQSVAFPLPWTASCTLSMWIRGTSAAAAVPIDIVGLRMVDKQPVLASTTFNVTTSWVRYTYTFTPPPAPGGRAYLRIDPPDNGLTDILIDGVQIEAGPTATAFAPAAPIEAAVTIDRSTRLYFPGESVTGQISLYNNGAATSRDLRRRVADVWGTVIGPTTTWTQNLPPGRTDVPATFTPAGNATGGYRAEVDVDSALTQPAADDLFAVIPPAPTAGQNAPFGTHIQFDSNTTIPRTAGAGWCKTWYLAWGASETAAGVWSTSQANIQNGYLNRWRDAGLKTLAVLEDVPSWARTSGTTMPADLSLATNYAQRMATNYGDRVAAWELCNEPDIPGIIKGGSAYASAQDAYNALALAFATGVRNVLPNAPILVGSATVDRSPELWIAAALLNNRANANGKTLRELVTGVSFHNYDQDPATSRRLAARIRAKLVEVAAATNTPSVATLEIWDTEWCPLPSPTSGYRVEPTLPNGASGPSARVVAATTVKGLVSRLGEGIKTNFLYQASGPNTLDDGAYNILYEYNRAPRASMAAHAVACAALTGATQPSALSAPGIWGYRFLRPDGRPLYVLWADEFQAGPVNFNAGSSVVATDMMGNAYGSGTYAPGANIPIGLDPVYLLGPRGDLQLSYRAAALVGGDPAGAATGTDFGFAEANYAPAAVTRTFTLTNLGAATITLNPATALTLGGTNAGDFTLLDPLPTSLAPGASVDFRLHFLPTATGARSATLTLASPQGSTLYNLAGLGTVAIPQLDLDASAISLHLVNGQGPANAVLQLSNPGRVALNWTASLPTAYTATDSNSTGGPIYAWRDITATGDPVTFRSAESADRDDEYSQQIDLPFPFVFHGTSYTSLRVTTNGVVNFGPGAAASNAPFTSVAPPSASAPNNAIFVLWDDLMMIGGISKAYSALVDANTFVISWVNVAYFSDRSARQSFQVLLKRDGTVIGQYATIAKSPNATGFVIGLQNNPTSSQALLYSQTPNPPANSLAVSFNPPGAAAAAAVGNFTPGAPASWIAFSGVSPTYAGDNRTVSTAGSVGVGSTLSIPLTFNPAGLLPDQTYRTTLRLTTNDQTRPAVDIPISFSVDAPTGLRPPTVVLTAPGDGANFTAGSNVTLTAQATPVDGAIDHVEFYVGSTLLGADYSAPYSVLWPNAPSGTYALTARAVVTSAATTTSAPARVTIQRFTPQISGAVAHWKLDETAGTVAADSSAATPARPLTLLNASATTWTTAGKLGGALDFNGASSTGATFTAPDLTAFSFAAWVQLDARGTYPRVLEMNGFKVLLRSDNFFLGLNSARSTTSGDWWAAGNPLSLGAWYHIAVTYDGSSTTNAPTFYLDGVKIAANTNTAPVGTPLGNAGTATIGNRPDGARPFDGRIDNVRIYDRVLTDAEIAQLASETTQAPPTAPANLTATAGSNGISLLWDPSAGSGLTYQVSRAPSANGPFANLGAPTLQPTFLDTTTSPGTTYFYEVTPAFVDLVGPTSPVASATALNALQLWRVQKFGSSENANAGADTADPDRDGVPNLVEYALGTDPQAISSGPTLDTAAGKLRISFRRVADPALTYEVWASDDLATWGATPIWSSTGADNTAGPCSVNDPSDLSLKSKRFLRLSISAP